MKIFTARTAGFVLVALLGAVLIFQLLMALGIGLTGAAWGGQLDASPDTLRLASLVAIVILVFFIMVVLEKLSIVRLINKPRIINGILWFLAAYLLLNAIANLLSPGMIEKLVMTPLALVSAMLCAIVARAPWETR